MSVRLAEMNLPRFPLLSDGETRELLAKAQSGDGEARERLINCNLKLVFSLLQRFQGKGYENEDLFQIGTIGLMKAIDKFDFTFDVKFSTYAVPMIIGEIRRFMRDDNPIRVSRSLKETAAKVNHIREKLTHELGREPSIAELAEKSGIAKEDIVEALEAVQTLTSIFEPVYQDEGETLFVVDRIADNRQDDIKFFDQISLRQVLNKLPERHQQIIYLRFFEDKTQSQVAKIVGLSQVQISRLERQALQSLRELMSG